MLVVMHSHSTPEQIEQVLETIREMGLTPHPMPGATRTAIGITGNTGAFDSRTIEVMPGVFELIRVTKPYKLASRSFRPHGTVVEIGEVRIGDEQVVVMAGPCSVESREQIARSAELVAESGGSLIRGGAFKPRSSPYSFQGLGEEGLRLLREAADRNGLLVVSEVMDQTQIPLVAAYADMLQIGARNMQNFNLLREAGKQRKPVLLKRGISATIEELLLSAEYILAGGNYDVVLC